MSEITKRPPTQTTWLLGRVFIVSGILMTLTAISLPLWHLTHPEQPPAADTPFLLPETPLLAELPEEAQLENVVGRVTETDSLSPRPTPQGYNVIEQPAFDPPERLTIASIDLDVSVIPVGWASVDVGQQTVGQWQVPDQKAAGWHDNSAGFAQDGNTVLNGHHNIYGQVFSRLVEVEVGDDISLVIGDDERNYIVTDTLILAERGQPLEVRLQNAQYILPTDDERLTLITCWPFTGNSHRLLVIARPALDQSENPLIDWLIP